MPIKLVKFYTREEIRANKNDLYVFGDNLGADKNGIRSGYGGQAYAARDEPNTCGIATKHSPGNRPRDFFSDKDFSVAKKEIDEKFQILRDHLNGNKGMVIWPMDGIGSGLADLPNRAPKIYKYIEICISNLKDQYGVEKC